VLNDWAVHDSAGTVIKGQQQCMYNINRYPAVKCAAIVITLLMSILLFIRFEFFIVQCHRP